MERHKYKTSQGEVWMDEDGILISAAASIAGNPVSS
jgi:hypothetical protein